MRQKTYDDDLLVRLIAEGNLTGRDIGKRLGLSAGFVCQVARGTSRPDLQPKLKQLIADGVGPGLRRLRRRAFGKRKEYCEATLVSMIAAGQKTYARIAEEVGLSGDYVAAIARGAARPELQPKIEAISKDMIRQAQRMGRSYARSLLGTHVAQGLHGTDEPARKAREFLLNRLLPREEPEPQAPADPEPDGPAPVGLTREDLQLIAERRGGPKE